VDIEEATRFLEIFVKASLNQSKSQLIGSWPPGRKSLGLGENIQNSSILFVDDCITSGTTARLCYEALVALGNHVDGLIWVAV
jgi:predicted amidophosphoribosyltransferase